MHITDVTQNKHFNDKYFGSIEFDLSKCILIFSFNDESKVCHILKDRMKIINVNSYKVNDKINIANKFIIPKLLKSINFDDNYKIIFPEQVLKFIIESYTYEGGVRKFKEILYDILLEINLRRLRDYKKPIKEDDKTINMIITEKLVENDFLKKKQKIQLININSSPMIGCVNGLWANSDGIGGLIPIECKWKPSDEKFKLELTGMQGDVMRESMSIALTIATNILPTTKKNELYKSLDKTFNKGIHIHCPDGSTPKDGPSAGCAITVSLVSLFTKIPVKNDIAMTGEINLKGEVTAIGGLEEKLEGAKNAGAKLVLCPHENIDTFNDIIEKNKTLINNNFNVMFIKNIWEALDMALTTKLPTTTFL
jgi:ATP-dependent Lon protease